jgi:replicative DNA helicase
LGCSNPAAGLRTEIREVSMISRRLKLASLDYGVPIIAAHQLNRASETEGKR